MYTVLLETTPEIADSLTVGMHLTDARGKGDAGELLAMTREPLLCEDAYGVYRHPFRVSVAVTLGGYGAQKESGVSLDGFVPRAGASVDLYGEARLSGLCIRVRTL